MSNDRLVEYLYRTIKQDFFLGKWHKFKSVLNAGNDYISMNDYFILERQLFLNSLIIGIDE